MGTSQEKYIDLKINILKTSITLSLIAFVSLAWGQSNESLACPQGTIPDLYLLVRWE